MKIVCGLCIAPKLLPENMDEAMYEEVSFVDISAAAALGWKRSSDPLLTEPGKDPIYICPKCIKKIEIEYGIPNKTHP